MNNQRTTSPLKKIGLDVTVENLREWDHKLGTNTLMGAKV